MPPPEGDALFALLLPDRLYGRQFRFLAPYGRQNMAAWEARMAALRAKRQDVPRPCQCCAAPIPKRRSTYCSDECNMWWGRRFDFGNPDPIVRLRDGNRCVLCRLDFSEVEPRWLAALEELRKETYAPDAPPAVPRLVLPFPVARNDAEYAANRSARSRWMKEEARIARSRRRDRAARAADAIGIPRLACADIESRLGEVDHVVPLAVGGSNLLSNLRLLCAPCHKEATAALAAMLALNRRADAAAQEAPLTDPARPADFRAHLRGLDADALHSVAISGTTADRGLALVEIQDRKMRRAYQLPRIDSMRVFDFLVLRAYSEHSSRDVRIRDLVALRDDARRGVFVGRLYQRATVLLHELYAPLGTKSLDAPGERERQRDT